MWNELKLALSSCLYHMFDSSLSAQRLAKPAHRRFWVWGQKDGRRVWTVSSQPLSAVVLLCSGSDPEPEGSVDAVMRRGRQGLLTDMDDSLPCLSWCPTAEWTSDYLPFSASVWTSPLRPRFLHPQLNASWLPPRCAAAFLSFFALSLITRADELFRSLALPPLPDVSHSLFISVSSLLLFIHPLLPLSA